MTHTSRRSLFAVWHWPRWTWAIILPLMIVSYPLSIGPAAWLHASGYLHPVAEDALETAYLPLKIAIGESKLIEAAAYWYIGFWINLP